MELISVTCGDPMRKYKIKHDGVFYLLCNEDGLIATYKTMDEAEVGMEEWLRLKETDHEADEYKRLRARMRP